MEVFFFLMQTRVLNVVSFVKVILIKMKLQDDSN